VILTPEYLEAGLTNEQSLAKWEWMFTNSSDPMMQRLGRPCASTSRAERMSTWLLSDTGS
jgi:hypothetical protein